MLEYGRVLGQPQNFTAQVHDFFAAGGHGLNVTLPFKQDAWHLATQRSPRADYAEAANTLMRMPDGSLFADNTDGAGLVRDLVINHGISITGRSILLLGAGGAARGVLPALLEQKPASIMVVNRTAAKATDLVKHLTATFAATGILQGGGMELIGRERFDIIINATSAGLSGQTPPLPVTCLLSDGIVYDLLYADQPTPFMRWGLAHGAGLAVDGLGMLVEQAAESFWLWRRVRPETKAIMQLLRPVQYRGEVAK